MNNITHPQSRGFIALTSVIVISALVFIIAIGSSMRSMSGSNLAIAQIASQEAFALAESCAEHALLSVKQDPAYAGNETLTIGGETCLIKNLDGGSPPQKTIRVESTVRSYTRRILIQVEASSTAVSTLNWQEVAEF